MRKLSKILITLLAMFTCIGSAHSTFIIKNNSAIGSATIKKTTDQPVAYIIGDAQNRRFTTIEKALESAISGQIVTVYPGKLDNYNNSLKNPADSKQGYINDVIPDRVSYEISRNCTIKEGVTLLLPTDNKTLASVNNASSLNTYISTFWDGARNRGNNSDYGGYARSNYKKYLRTTVTVADNVVITNKGNLVISGYCSSGTNSPGKVGQTSHSYARMLLGEGTKIIQDSPNAAIYCGGFIDEVTPNNNSSILLRQGSAHIPIVVDDYKGFTTSFAMTAGAIDTNHCAPFNQFEFNNISVKTEVSYNVNVESYASIWATYTNPNFDKVFLQKIPLVGTAANYVFQFNNSSYSSLTYKFDLNSQVADVDFYGGLNLNNIGLKIKESIVTVDMNTKNAFLPVSYRFNVSLNAGQGQANANYDFSKQRVKLLPGSRLEINKNASVNESEMSVYSALFDSSLFNGYSSNRVGGANYPIKPGAILVLNDNGSIKANALAGTVYGSVSNITKTTDSIICSEPWSIGSSGSVNPPWKITDFLQVREKLNILSLDNLNKPKIYGGLQIFSNYDSFLPAYNINLDNGDSLNVSQFQKVFVLNETPQTFKLQFLNNVYKAFKNNSYYKKNETVIFNENNSIITSISSTMNISSNANGVNEFDVQSVSVECSTPTVQGVIPLWPNSSINLKANVDDINKAYDKTIIWTSSDESVAIVDENGKVDGLKLGPVTIYAKCDGVIGEINLNVIEEIQISNVESISISDDKGGSSLVEKSSGNTKYNNKYNDHTDVTFKVDIAPIGAPYASIKWTLNKSDVKRQYIVDKTINPEVVNNQETVLVHINEGAGATDDIARINCEVVGLDGVMHSAVFVICHHSDLCYAKGTLIRMADGTEKPVENITINDKVMAFNHESGKYQPCKLLAVVDHGMTISKKITMHFDNGRSLAFVGNHEIFDKTLMKYVEINKESVAKLLGHNFATYNLNNKAGTAKMISYTIDDYQDNSYTLVSYQHMNIVAENMLTFTPNLHGLNNYFTYDDDLSYNKQLKELDIKQYGLYTYDDWKDFVPLYMFEGYNFKYFKVSIGKGLMTYEDVLNYIEYSNSLMENNEIIYPHL